MTITKAITPQIKSSKLATFFSGALRNNPLRELNYNTSFRFAFNISGKVFMKPQRPGQSFYSPNLDKIVFGDVLDTIRELVLRFRLCFGVTFPFHWSPNHIIHVA